MPRIFRRNKKYVMVDVGNASLADHMVWEALDEDTQKAIGRVFRDVVTEAVDEAVEEIYAPEQKRIQDSLVALYGHQ